MTQRRCPPCMSRGILMVRFPEEIVCIERRLFEALTRRLRSMNSRHTPMKSFIRSKLSNNCLSSVIGIEVAKWNVQQPRSGAIACWPLHTTQRLSSYTRIHTTHSSSRSPSWSRTNIISPWNRNSWTTNQNPGSVATTFVAGGTETFSTAHSYVTNTSPHKVCKKPHNRNFIALAISINGKIA